MFQPRARPAAPTICVAGILTTTRTRLGPVATLTTLEGDVIRLRGTGVGLPGIASLEQLSGQIVLACGTLRRTFGASTMDVLLLVPPQALARIFLPPV